MSLIKRWRLTNSPLRVSVDMMNEIEINFRSDTNVTVSDTANSSSGTYTIDNNIPTIKCCYWTERARMWDNDEDWKAACVVDKFIHSIINKPIPYDLKDNILTLRYNDQDYQFE